jgi:hypothetical protein
MMRKLFFIISIIILTGSSSISQVNYDKKYLDSVFTEYVNLKEIATNKDYNKLLAVRTENSKCGLFLVNFVKQNIDLFSPQQQQLLKNLSGRPSLPKSIVSPFGKFRIHYDTTSAEKPKYISSMSIEDNLSQIALAIDSAYNFEVNYLEYPSPPSDNGIGGDNLYDIYIVNLGGGLYGYTELENDLGGQKYTSFMVIDNDYAGYYSSGIKGAKVTLAHEFHHGIQMGNYILRFDDTFFYEITSTSMEEFVFDDVNDYYVYMPSYFLSPQKAFAENDGYNLAIWNIYLKENFGFDIIKKQWELMPTDRAMNVINTSLSLRGSSFKHELNQFGVWTYYTKHRAIPGKYFEEATVYPLVRPLSTIAFTSPNETVTINSKATANNFIRFTNQTNNNDTLFVLITNGDVQGAVSNISQTDSITYYLYDHPESGANQIDSNYYSRFTTKNPYLWSVSEITDTVINVEPQPKTDFPFPMPFSYKKYSENQPINIPVSSDNDGNVGLYIFSTGMELIFSNDDMPRDSQNKNLVKWVVKDNQGRKLASGVYIYVIKAGDDVQKGKLVILHD